MPYQVKKHFGHELGLSACFRQWRAESHCRHLHGYALAFTFVFECDKLDDRGWVIDFGSLKGLKRRLETAFDHRLCIADDDPHLTSLMTLAEADCANPNVMHAVGCEAFARMGYQMASQEVFNAGLDPRVRVVSCECAEHGANSATYIYRDDS